MANLKRRSFVAAVAIAALCAPGGVTAAAERAATSSAFSAPGTNVAVFFDKVLQGDPDVRSARLVAPAGMLQMLAMLQAGSAGDTRSAITSVLGANVTGIAAPAWQHYLSVPRDVRQGNALWLVNGFRGSQSFKDFAFTIGMPIDPFFSPSTGLYPATKRWLSSIGVPNAPIEVPDADILGLNVIAIHANWVDQFDRNLSRPGPFHAAGSDRTVTYMQRYGVYKYLRSPSLQAVNLPYTDGLSLWLGLDSDAIPNLPLLLDTIARDDGRLMRGTIVLPRMKVHTHVYYKTLLKPTPLRALFARDANFSPMLGTGDHNGGMSQLLQDISLSIDETGTQATAVTEVYRLKMIMFEFRLTFDHPFTFAIQNDATGALLLSGVILDPTAQ